MNNNPGSTWKRRVMSTAEPDPIPNPPTPKRVASSAERRHLTVLFCDLVGSTALTSAMDPEDLHYLTRRFLDECVVAVESSDGYVARFEGDGVLAYFGYPSALEDAAQRAIHAGLAVREAAKRISKPGGEPFSVRVGVATGLVVVGDLISARSTQEHTVTGEAPNLAKRVQALAAPDAIIVSNTTKRLAEGVFEFEWLGEILHKGFPTPTPIWKVIGPRTTISRYEGRRVIGVSPLVGREAEFAVLARAWREARAGRPQVVGIVGEPGIGKSRLVEEARRVFGEDSDAVWLEGGGVSIHDNTPFHIVAQVATQLGLNPFADPSVSEQSVEAPDSQHNVIRRVSEYIWSVADRVPVVIVAEDLHWVDPSTLKLLFTVMAVDNKALLLIYTSRVEVGEGWPVDRHQVIRLAPFGETASVDLTKWWAAGNLSLARIESIVSQAAGVPLYIEELTRRIVQQPDIGDHELPSTLVDLLAKGLEDLGPARRHAQIAAVLGNEFPGPLFAAILQSDETDARGALAALVKAEVLVRRETEGMPIYAFRHALIAKAAYDSLLIRRRQAVHARAAKVIVEHFSGLAETEPQVLARHWAEAGDAERAIAAWERAGDLATGRRALREAEHAYRQALLLLQAGSLANNDRREMRLHAAFGRVLQVTQGYSAQEAATSSDRVRELATQIGAGAALAREELLRWRSVFTTGDYAKAETIADRFMTLTEAQGDAPWRLSSRLRAGIQHGFYTGDLARAERDFLAWQALKANTPVHRGPGDDVLSMGVAALVAALDGRETLARQRLGAAKLRAERGGPYDLAMALHAESGLNDLSRDFDALSCSAKRLCDLAHERGFEYADHLATAWLATVDAEAGRHASALERVTTAIAGFNRLNARVAITFWYGVLGRMRWLNGDVSGAQDAFAQALSSNIQERVFHPDVLIERATMFAALGRRPEAEGDLKAASRRARSLGARIYRVRALVMLGQGQLAADEQAGLRRSLRGAQEVVRDRPDLCARDRADLAALASAASRSTSQPANS